jgi:hypothetical protein
MGELTTQIDRNIINAWRDPGELGASLGSSVFVAIIIMALFNNVKNDVSGKKIK